MGCVRIAATGIAATSRGRPVVYPTFSGARSRSRAGRRGDQRRVTRCGDRVVLALTHHCGHCSCREQGTPCSPLGAWRPRRLSSTEPTCFRDSVPAPSRMPSWCEVSCVRIPDGVPFTDAACSAAPSRRSAQCRTSRRCGRASVVVAPADRAMRRDGCAVSGASASSSSTRPAPRSAPSQWVQPRSHPDEMLEAHADGFRLRSRSGGQCDARRSDCHARRPSRSSALPTRRLRFPSALDFVVSRRLLDCLTGDVHNTDFDVLGCTWRADSARQARHPPCR